MAGSFNKVILVGRLGQDPKLAYTQSGDPVVNLSLATDESYKDKQGNRQEKTEWHRIVAFGKTADLCSQYLFKGSMALVEGSLQTRQWEDQQGQKRYTTEVKALRVQFMDGKGSPRTEAQPAREPAPVQAEGPAFPTEAKAMDDVPF